jgi:CBS domain-containing protein
MSSLIDRSEFEKPLAEMNFPKPEILSEEITLLEALAYLQEHRIGCLLLGQGSKLTGVLTERDFVLRIIGLVEDWKSLPAKDFMTKGPSTLSSDDMVIKAIEVMTTEEFRHLPIVDSSGAVTAILSVKDLLGLMVNSFKDDIESAGIMTEWNYDNTINYDEKFSSLLDGKGQISSSIFFAQLKRVIYKKAVCIDHKHSVQDALLLMQKKRVGSLLVMEFETRIKGIITERDILFKFLGKIDFTDIRPVTDFMTPDPHVLLHRHTLAHAVNNMFRFKYRNTIVVNEDRYPLSLVGLLEVFRFISLHLFK